MHRALEAAEALAGEGVSAEVIDLRTIQPLDVETVAASVRKTHRLLVVDEAYAMFGVGAELAQSVNELAFDWLDAPVARLHSEPVTHPFAPALEREMLVNTDKIMAAARDLMKGIARPIARMGAAGRPAAAAAPAPQAPRPSPAPAPAAAARRQPKWAGAHVAMPFGDLTVSSGKLVRWLKRVGDRVQAAELVAEIETDKAVVEIEASDAGILAEQLYQPGETVEMGAVLAVVARKGEEGVAAS